MSLMSALSAVWAGLDRPFLIHEGNELGFDQIASLPHMDLSDVHAGDVVALIGDFNPASILALIDIIDSGAIIVPLTKDTREQHEYFFDAAMVDVVIKDGVAKRRHHDQQHEFIEYLRKRNHAGLVLFSTGTTGLPKAILHDLTLFLKRFETPRPTLRTLSFLLFDHIGGLNTLLHTLFNTGVVVSPVSRTVDSILDTCDKYKVEVLPTTPTFLRMMLMSGAVPGRVPNSLKIITYGTERMDQPTLEELCRLLPDVDFRQTFGMSELGIVRVKSKDRSSLYMKIGGEGVETAVVDGVLRIRSQSRMLGYLNAPSPFDEEGWYDTKDMVEEKDGYYRISGRTSDVINVAGLKFMASEVERVALKYSGVSLVKAYPRDNPITGQHVELKVQPKQLDDFDRVGFKTFLKSVLPAHMMPRKILIENVPVGHRFKRV